MTDKIVNLPNLITTLDLKPDTILEKAKGNPDIAVIIGYDKEGEFYFASTKSDGGDVVWMLELAKRKLFEIIEELDEDS